ncbi:MAG: hypothetical protein ACK5ME_03820 [Parahaliea sp.]
MLNQTHTKDASGRGTAIIAYGLLMGSIMLPPTALIAVVIAALWLPRSASWVNSHLRYQIMTVVWSYVGLISGGLLWWAFGSAQLTPRLSWTFGYMVFTCLIVWLIYRCAFGLNRLIDNRGIAGTD